MFENHIWEPRIRPNGIKPKLQNWIKPENIREWNKAESSNHNSILTNIIYHK